MLGSRTRGARYLIIKGRTRKAQILPKVPRLFIYSDSLTLEVRWTRGCLLEKLSSNRQAAPV